MSNFVSLCELPEQLRVTEHGKCDGVPVQWDMQLPPHVDTERLQINVSRLRVMHRVGAFAASYVRSYEGDITETTPNIVGVNADGSTIAGKSGITKKAKKAEGSCADPYSQSFRPMVDDTHGRTVAIHKLNRPELASQVADRVSEGDNSNNAWAGQLDLAVRESMRKSGREHLTSRANISDAACIGIHCLSLGMLVESGSLQLAAFTYLFGQAAPELGPIRFRKLYGEDYNRPPRRWSLLPFGYQFDRYIALNGLARMPGLIRSQK